MVKNEAIQFLSWVLVSTPLAHNALMLHIALLVKKSQVTNSI